LPSASISVLRSHASTHWKPVRILWQKSSGCHSNFEHLQAADPRIRGILGGNFLEQFDVLIDYPHTILYLDNAKVMQPQIKGNTSRW
jgi:hypothetical protein